MAETRIVVKGLDELAKELRRADPQLAKQLQQANKSVSVRVVNEAHPAIKGLPSPGGSKAASGGLKPTAGAKSAKVIIQASNPTVHANVFGALSHMVWGRRAAGRGPWQPWLGNSWSPEDLYGLGPALTQVMDGYALDQYADAWLDGLGRAFPIRGG